MSKSMEESGSVSIYKEKWPIKKKIQQILCIDKKKMIVRLLSEVINSNNKR